MMLRRGEKVFCGVKKKLKNKGSVVWGGPNINSNDLKYTSPDAMQA